MSTTGSTGGTGAESVTRAEKRVLDELVSDGADNAELARRLGRSEKTIKAHLGSLMRQAGVSNRTALALWYIRGGRYLRVRTYQRTDERLAREAARGPQGRG